MKNHCGLWKRFICRRISVRRARNAAEMECTHRKAKRLHFTNDGERDLSPVRRTTMLEQEYALPGSKLHFPIDNRHCLAGARQRHADVRWHVVAAFGTVSKIMSILRDQTIEKFLQVAPRGGIGIFHDDQAAAGVLNKDSHRSIADAGLVDLCLNFICDFVGPFSISADFELILLNTHRRLENNTGSTNSRALIFVPGSGLLSC
jgi:hypothetical protein